MSGDVGSYLEFNTQLLGKFVNAITLPDQGLENSRLLTNAALSSLGEIPFVGTVAGVVGGVTDYFFDQAQIEAQLEATEVVLQDAEYDSANWGKTENLYRDTV